MAEMAFDAPLRADGKEPNFLQRFGHALAHGDIFTKLSFLIWGLGYIGHGQLIKAVLVTLVQGLGLYYLGVAGITCAAREELVSRGYTPCGRCNP